MILRVSGYSLPYGLGGAGHDSRIALPRRIIGAGRVYVGECTLIRRGSEIHAIERTLAGQHFKPRISIGNRVYIGQNLCIASINAVAIGDLCVLSDHVYLTDAFHGLNPPRGPIQEQSWESRGPVTIGVSTFIGYGAVVLPGVALGKNCVVGANAVVTHSFPDYSMVAGVPARLIKSFDVNRGEWLNSSD